MTDKVMVAFSVSEKDGETFYNRVGYAVLRSDKSIDIKIDAIPLSGRIKLRERRDDVAPALGARPSGIAAEA